MEKQAIYLKPGREKSVRQRHPWIFSGAVDRVSGKVLSGDTVEVFSSIGEWLAWAAYSPQSNIRARIWSWNREEKIDSDFFQSCLIRAFKARQAILPPETLQAARLVYAESDGLPGIVVDRYSDWLVFQCLTAGAERWREEITSSLISITGLSNIFERSDVDVRSLEGLQERTGLLSGKEPPERVEIQENSLRYWVDIRGGQKTGFYLDQRRNRRRVSELVRDMEVLNCFCYTGGFSLSALLGGARHVLSIDSSAGALALATENARLNGFSENKAIWHEADVFQALRGLRDRGRFFDAIILDPPKFAPTAAQAERAARGYKDINLLAFKLLRPGGLLFTFSCSGGISADLFQKIVAGAALDAGVDARIIEQLSQDVDHPVALNFPESAYLKGLICQKIG